MYRSIIILWLFTTFGIDAHAEPFSGNEVFRACEGEEVSVQQGFCFGYILGTVEGLKWGSITGLLASSGQLEADEYDVLSSIALGFCIPPTVENGQVLDVVIKYLLETPEVRHETARTLIQSALANSFPCP